MPAIEVKIRKTGPDPEVEVIIGQAQQGKYRIRLWDTNGLNPIDVAHGVNWDDVADVKPLGDKKRLHGCYLTWEILVTSPGGGTGELYAVTVEIRQGGSTCDGGLFQESGKLDGTRSVFGSRRFVVV